MPKNPHKASVEAALLERSQRIQDRFDALQSETGQLGQSVRKQVLGSPWLSAGVALGAGLLVGLAVGGSKRRLPKAGGHLGALSDEVLNAIQRAANKGQDPAQAVEHVLLSDLALRPATQANVPKSSSMTKTLMGMALRFGLQMALSKWKARSLDNGTADPTHPDSSI